MIKPNKSCTACGACVQKCPKSCIIMKEDINGFLFPYVNTSNCIECRLCNKVCHLNINVFNDVTKIAFACAHKSEEILKKSASGGAFTAIAEKIFSYGGVVYGCAYVTPTDPQHIRIDKQEDLSKLRGSKYVQSTIGNSYKQVQNDLSTGKIVFFTGTPCQIAGLKAFLGKNYDTLITADIICHGVPSVAYFKKYIEWYEKKHKCKVKNFNFRDKINKHGTYAGVCYAENKEKTVINKFFYYNEYYYYYFLKSELFRDSCYECKYTNLHRVGDFTLGDFWGAEGQKLNFNITNGCSLVLLNTEKAKKIFNELNVHSSNINLDFAIKNNKQLQEPSRHTKLRETLLIEYRKCSADEIQKKFKRRFRIPRIKSRMKYAIPPKIRNMLLKFRYSIK